MKANDLLSSLGLLSRDLVRLPDSEKPARSAKPR